MANEFKITVSMTYENGQLKHTYSPGTKQLPQATQGYDSKVVTINSSVSEAVSFDVTTNGMCYLQNLEATTTGNFVKYGAASTSGALTDIIGYLYPKEVHVLHLSSTATFRAQADTAAVNVLFFVGEQ